MIGPAAVAAVYIALMAVGMAVMHHGFGFTYGAPEMAYVILPVEVVLSAWAVLAARRQGGWKALTLGRPSRAGLLWLLPLALPMLATAALVGVDLVRAAPALQPDQWRLLAVVAGCTALVGFSEELVFRGLLLRGAWRLSGLFHAMLVSAAGFSLLHSVNVLGGSTPGQVGIQLGFTLLFGLLFAPLAVKVGALWPLMVLHFLWDFSLYAAPLLPGGAVPAVSAAILPIQLLLGPVLWWSLRAHRGLTAADWHRAQRGEAPLA